MDRHNRDNVTKDEDKGQLDEWQSYLHFLTQLCRQSRHIYRDPWVAARTLEGGRSPSGGRAFSPLASDTVENEMKESEERVTEKESFLSHSLPPLSENESWKRWSKLLANFSLHLT